MYFAGRFRYRKATGLTGAILALGLGLVPALLAVPDVLRGQWPWGGAFSAASLGLLCTLLLLSGIKLLRRWFIGATLLLEISDDGVRYGGRDFGWNEVQWIGGRSDQGHVQLILKCKGAVPELQLLVDEPLTVDRYDALMQELSAALKEKHPQVAVG
jgi:hypothetical protein